MKYKIQIKTVSGLWADPGWGKNRNIFASKIAARQVIIEVCLASKDFPPADQLAMSMFRIQPK